MPAGMMSARGVSTPIGSSGQYGSQPAAAVVPLSVFFLNMQGKGVDGEDSGLYGKRKREKKPKRKKPGVDAAKAPGEGTMGGDAELADRANQNDKGKGQTTAAESVSGATLTPIKVGATRASSGSMGTGNVTAYHVPLGPLLRRMAPWAGPGSKRKKLTKEERGRWVERMTQM